MLSHNIYYNLFLIFLFIYLVFLCAPFNLINDFLSSPPCLLLRLLLLLLVISKQFKLNKCYMIFIFSLVSFSSFVLLLNKKYHFFVDFFSAFSFTFFLFNKQSQNEKERKNEKKKKFMIETKWIFDESERDGRKNCSLKSQQRININFRRFAYELWRKWKKYIFLAREGQ